MYDVLLLPSEINMRHCIFICLLTVAVVSSAETPSSGPADARAQRTFADAKQHFSRHEYGFALEEFRKADKQDGGACGSCEQWAYDSALPSGQYKAAAEEAELILNHATNDQGKAEGHLLGGVALLRDGLAHNHEKFFEDADRQFKAAIQLQPHLVEAFFLDGLALAHLKQDESAQIQFRQYLQVANGKDVNRERAQRYVERPELARARMAPAFQVETLDGQSFSLDSLAGKVVLIDFWATWCGPCREALPHVRDIAKHFAGPNFAVLSVSLDNDEAKWKDFVAKNNMTWAQYRDKGFDGKLSTLFGVHEIPHTFVIDADGVLQDERVGDAEIEGKLKKLIARAQQLQQENASSIAKNASQQ
jgi:peroxiredoxin